MISKDVLSKIKILAFDIDDTLLNEKNVVSERNAETLKKAAEKGYYIVVATGRVLSAVPKDVLAVRDIRYAVTSNGARVTDTHTGRSVYTNFLDREEVERILPLLSDPSVMKEAFFNNQVYADRHCLENLPQYGVRNEWNRHYITSTRTPVESALELIRQNADSLENINLIFADPKHRDRIAEELKSTTQLAVFPSPLSASTADIIEIGGKTASKAMALKAFAESVGLNESNVMAFGDSSNDVPMLRSAAVGVAMGNAVEEVKAVSDHITASNAEDGVAQALEELLGI